MSTPMPVPLPTSEATRLGPPDADEVIALTYGVLSAIEPATGHRGFQEVLVSAAFEAMTGHAIDTTDRPTISAEEFAAGLADRNEAFRIRILQTMILGALVLRPIPPEVAARVEAFARAISVDDGMLAVARRFASGQLGLAAFDFQRNGYTADWSPERARALHAQHDWVHVLADYGSKVESELEVFAFIARANDDPRGFSLLAMVVSLFETGYLATGAGLFESFPGRLSRDGMAVRVADALRRGALTHGLDGAPDVDFLAIDWFALADQPVDELRKRCNVVPKSTHALAAGAVGPWEPGGISEYQYAHAAAAAEASGASYDAYGATP